MYCTVHILSYDTMVHLTMSQYMTILHVGRAYNQDNFKTQSLETTTPIIR